MRVTPFAIAAGVGAVGSIASGLISGNASESAAKTQAGAAASASQTEQNQFNQTQQNLAPYMGAGTNALAALQSALGIGPGGTGAVNPTGFTGSPGYQFQMGQGVNAVQNAASNQGGVNSGNTLKALTQFGQGLADSTWQQYLGNLTGLVNTGQSSAAGVGALGANNANQIGANTIGAGNATAAGTVGGANALTGGINGLSQNALLYALMNQNQVPNSAALSNNNINLYNTPAASMTNSPFATYPQ